MTFSAVAGLAALSRPTLSKAAVAYFSSHQTSNLIVNAVGADRPGIVSDITRYVTDSGGNVGRSQAARLGDYFSLIMQVQVPSTQVDSLKQSLTSMPGMNASIFETADIKPPGAAATPTIAYSGEFTLEGASFPGIVHKMTAVLANHGLNIETMGTVEEIAPTGGTILFRMKGLAHAYEPLPKTFDAHRIRDELAELGDSLNCEVSLEDVADDSYSGSFYAG